MNVLSQWTLVSLGGLAVLGCSRNEQLPTAPVHLTVTIDGMPLKKGTVVFTPVSGRQARGEIQGDGTASLSTYGSHDGAIIGRHTIAVIATEVDSDTSTDGRLAAVKWLIPEKFGSGDTSGMTCEVTDASGHELTLSLASDGTATVR